jgi:predicted PurR-regulated permease PerM
MESINLRQRLFFFVVFAILILLTLTLLRPFLTVIIVSLISVIMLKPVYNFFLSWKWLKGRKGLASTLTLVALFAIVIIPILLIVQLTVSQLSGAFEDLSSMDLDTLVESINGFFQGLPFLQGIQVDAANLENALHSLAGAVGKALADFAVSLVSSLPNLIVQGVIFIVMVASLLPVYDVLIPQLEEISPLGPEISELYTLKITAMVKSLVLGVFLIAIIQGAAMGFFFWIAGLPYVFLLTLLSMLLAMIPMVGISWLVIALAVLLFLTGNSGQALTILFGFYGVVNWIDLLLRPKLLRADAALNFALFLLAIFGGIAWAGIMGLFYGPVIMLLLVTTIDIYVERYANEDRTALDRIFRNLANNSRAGSSAAEVGEAQPE